MRGPNLLTNQIIQQSERGRPSLAIIKQRGLRYETAFWIFPSMNRGAPLDSQGSSGTFAPPAFKCPSEADHQFDGALDPNTDAEPPARRQVHAGLHAQIG